jgi:glutamine synthetase type III
MAAGRRLGDSESLQKLHFSNATVQKEYARRRHLSSISANRAHFVAVCARLKHNACFCTIRTAPTAHPFAGVNGSGKHLNWSMSDDEGHNLLSPGGNPHDNLRFLIFCTTVLRAVNKWQGQLRAKHRQRGQRSSPRRQ